MLTDFTNFSMNEREILEILDVSLEKIRKIPFYKKRYSYVDLMEYFPEETKKYIAKINKQTQLIKAVLESYLKEQITVNYFFDEKSIFIQKETDSYKILITIYADFGFIENIQFRNEVLVCLSKPERVPSPSFSACNEDKRFTDFLYLRQANTTLQQNEEISPYFISIPSSYQSIIYHPLKVYDFFFTN